MPIRPENRHRYPADWPDISSRVRFQRAGGRCECTGECARPDWHLIAIDGRCGNVHGLKAWKGLTSLSDTKVVLTVAHLDHTPENNDPDNLRAMCQGCHLHYDREHHAETRQRTIEARRVAAGQVPLPMPTIDGDSQ